MTLHLRLRYSDFLQSPDAGVDWVIMEDHFYGIAPGRVGGLKQKSGIVTNLTQDHLDYHKTMEKYAAAKPCCLPDIMLRRDIEW